MVNIQRTVPFRTWEYVRGKIIRRDLGSLRNLIRPIWQSKLAWSSEELGHRSPDDRIRLPGKFGRIPKDVVPLPKIPLEGIDITCNQDRTQASREIAHLPGLPVAYPVGHHGYDHGTRRRVLPKTQFHATPDWHTSLMNAPTTSPDRTNAERLAAASLAAGAVKDGMVIGFGTGRAAEAVLTILARRVYEGLKVSGIPTSIATEAHARALGLPLTDLSAHPSLDLTIDGSDEVDPARNLIKGGGAALFREKVLAAASDRLIVVVDSTKLVTRLGSTRGIPVEVLPFATGACIRQIAEMGGEAIVRTKNESPVVTDNGNWVLDVTFDAEAMANPRALDTAMRAIPGVIITGLFWSFDATVVVGTQGGTEILGPPL